MDWRTLRMAWLLLAVAAGSARADALLWDNFPSTPEFPNGYDDTRRLTSERDTQVGIGPDAATWTIDDFHFGAQPLGQAAVVRIDRLEWVGVREMQNRPGFGYDLADWAIFERVGNGPTFDFLPVFAANDVGWNEVQDLGTVPGHPQLRVFLGSIDLSGQGVLLQPDTDYWVGVRLIGNPANQTGGTAGRHFIAVASGNPLSVDEGYNYDPNFTLNPGWVPASTRNPFGEPLEFAYRVYATIIPEPSGAVLMVLAFMLVHFRLQGSRRREKSILSSGRWPLIPRG